MPLAHTMVTLWAQKGRNGKPSQHQVLRKAKTKDQVPWNLSYIPWSIPSASCVFPVTRRSKYTLLYREGGAARASSHIQGEKEHSGSMVLKMSCAFPKANCDPG